MAGRRWSGLGGMGSTIKEFDDMVDAAYASSNRPHQFRLPDLPEDRSKKSNSKKSEEKRNTGAHKSLKSTDVIKTTPAPPVCSDGENKKNNPKAVDQKSKSPNPKKGDAVKLSGLGPSEIKIGLKTDSQINENIRSKSSRSSEFGVVIAKEKMAVTENSQFNPNISNNTDIFSYKLSGQPGLTKYTSSRDLAYHQNDRFSAASSANSSLGLISSEVLDEASRVPLVDDLSFRLAQNLDLDPSLLKDGMDLSTLAGERYKEKVASKCEDKENRSSRSSSDYWTIHGYASDNSDSKNNTAKRISALSEGSGRSSKSPRKSPYSRQSRPLSEINSTTPRFRPTSNQGSGRFSLGSDPFADYSKISVNSDDFQSNEDTSQRLLRDEREFSLASTRSLSGIYDSANISVNVNGEKLSMYSFLRSGSGPLGSLGTGSGDCESPQFGMLATSPEKKGRPRAIHPPPQEKPTFVLDEEPVRDTPWAPHSLVEQYSSIHSNGDATEADVSGPSMSYINDMLDQMRKGANPKELYHRFPASLSESKNKQDSHSKPNKITSFVEGDDDSFCQGIGVEHNSMAEEKSGLLNPDSQVSLDESFCNVTDFEGDEDACVCVMTPQAMDFDIFNDLNEPVEYSFAKACYVNGDRKDNAVYVHFPSSKLMLNPDQKQTVTIHIAALVEGAIKVRIEVTRRNPLTQARERSIVYGKIVAEIPKLILRTNRKVEMMPNLDCRYEGKYQHTIELINKGRSTVPLKLILTKTADDDVEFNFGEKEKKEVVVMVEPGQVMRQLVQCETPPVFAHLQPPDSVFPVVATVTFRLASTDVYQLYPVDPITVVAPLKPYFFGAPPTMVVPGLLKLYNSCEQPAVFTAKASTRFTVHPQSFTIPAQKTFLVTVNTEGTGNPRRNGELYLMVGYPMGKTSRYIIHLREDLHNTSSNSLDTPHSSRATSPISPSHSVPVEDLKVACSMMQLVWGGCRLHHRVVKSFCIKNMGRQREKLRLTTSDPCFKIVCEEDSLKPEFKLSLQPMENREIKVAVLATVAGPQWGLLTICRIGRGQDKNVLPLYAFGGKPQVSLTHGVFEVETNKFLFLDEKSLQGSFAMSNSGDNTAFFRVSEANSKSSAGLSISPQQCVLAPGHTSTIQVGLSINAKRIEYLLRQTAPSVCVAQLSVRWGDESTRQRLLRTRGLAGVLAERVSQLSCLPSQPIADLDKLDMSANDAEALWEEDTDEWAIGVFIKRTALEALALDTSEDFVDLATTMTNFQR